MGGILSRSLPGPLHLQGLVLQQRVPLRVFLHLSALSPLPAPAMGQPGPRLGEGPREGRNRATGSLPCCSCGGRGGCVTSRRPPLPLPSHLASSSPSRGSTRLPAGSRPPARPQCLLSARGVRGGKGPQPRRRSLRLLPAPPLQLRPAGRLGGRGRVSAPPAAPASLHTGAAPLTWCFQPRSGSRRSLSDRDPRLGHGPGPPRASRCLPGLPQSQPGRAFLAAPAIFVSSPVVGRISAQARGVRSPFVRVGRPLSGPQDHRGV
ncbi:hypothetical protein NDU88_008066 [Pleurodeles waltl]|uniref:Uncharacterized protein n=1 Tax=Pleurodeles waltl TaxID=8319 RepID=A0AAV7VW58_PLEWA|nr:hypothetical protein NDU88_008066 [Pleurodeles waltl]